METVRHEQGETRAHLTQLSPRRLSVASWLLAAGAPPAAAAALVVLRSHVSDSALALLMVLVVVLVVSPGRRLAALLAGVSAGVWFDFFLTRPYESFTISHSADIQTAAMLVAVAVGVGELAARERQHKSQSVTGHDALQSVQAVSELVAQGASAEVVTSAAEDALVRLLHLRSCRFDPARAVVTVPFVERPGYISYTAFRWDARNDGLPVGEVTLPVSFEHRLLGRFVLEGPDPPVPVEPERLHAAVVLADLAGLALATGRRPHLSVVSVVPAGTPETA